MERLLAAGDTAAGEDAGPVGDAGVDSGDDDAVTATDDAGVDDFPAAVPA